MFTTVASLWTVRVIYRESNVVISFTRYIQTLYRTDRFFEPSHHFDESCSFRFGLHFCDMHEKINEKPSLNAALSALDLGIIFFVRPTFVSFRLLLGLFHIELHRSRHRTTPEHLTLLAKDWNTRQHYKAWLNLMRLVLIFFSPLFVLCMFIAAWWAKPSQSWVGPVHDSCWFGSFLNTRLEISDFYIFWRKVSVVCAVRLDTMQHAVNLSAKLSKEI